jgi:hypothetical protein
MRVEWREFALDELADIFVAADPVDRDGIERAVVRISGELADEPERLGESRSTGSRRVWFSYPLVVVFEIRRSEALVQVTNVARLKHR